MNPKKLFPLVITADLPRTRAFYLDQLGYDATFDGNGYLQIRFGADASAPELAFMAPDAAPILGEQPIFAGRGLIVSIPTANADEHHRELTAKKVRVLGAPGDKPWGWRSYGVVDPNGVVLDFFHVLGDATDVDATG